MVEPHMVPILQKTILNSCIFFGPMIKTKAYKIKCENYITVHQPKLA